MTHDTTREVFPRPRWMQTAMDAYVSLMARDPWMRERYGRDGDRCPIVASPAMDRYVCLSHGTYVRPDTIRCDE